MKIQTKNIDTLAIHGGSDGRNACNALNPPIYQTSTFVFDSIEHVEKVMSFQCSDYVYTRGNNPTLRLFENMMAVLEEGEAAVAFASGMAAISSVIFSLLRSGDNILLHKTIYGSTHKVVTTLLPKYGMSYVFADLNDVNELESIVDEKTKLIYFETPSNPNLGIVDIRRIVEFAHSRGIKVVVDNTFASPYFQKPLTMGVDVVVHSATKYICGHGDAIAGVAVSKDPDYVKELKFDYMSSFGGAMSPFNAWLLLRGLKTLGIRMRQHEANAMEIAKYLEVHPKIKKVFYPGLPSFENHEVAASQMTGYGAIIAFEIDGTMQDARTVVNSVQLMQLALSLGDCESLIEIPSIMTHKGNTKEELEKQGMSETMIRISVGLEACEDIIRDLEQALNQI